MHCLPTFGEVAQVVHVKFVAVRIARCHLSINSQPNDSCLDIMWLSSPAPSCIHDMLDRILIRHEASLISLIKSYQRCHRIIDNLLFLGFTQSSG